MKILLNLQTNAKAGFIDKHLVNVGLQHVRLFLGLLELLCQFGSGLVQLLLQGLVRSLQLSQLLHTISQGR